jgi:hypothetical protein
LESFLSFPFCLTWSSRIRKEMGLGVEIVHTIGANTMLVQSYFSCPCITICMYVL